MNVCDQIKSIRVLIVGGGGGWEWFFSKNWPIPASVLFTFQFK